MDADSSDIPSNQPHLRWLYGTQLFGMKMGLDRMRELLKAIGDPHLKLPIVHVAGTNGKGSVCATIEALARAHGLRTGLYTSPHLRTFHERIRVAGDKISTTDLESALLRIRQVVEHWNPHPTFFEIATAAALDHFNRQGTNAVVLETGLGGRLDATNVVTPLLSVLTPIAMDHTRWLGDSLTAIAREKAGIIKPRVPVISAPQDVDALSVIQEACRISKSDLHMVEPLPDDIPLALRGDHQRANTALAVAAAKHVGWCPQANDVPRVLASVSWPGRLQAIGSNWLLDGAHNPHGARALADFWRATYGARTTPILFSALHDKDLPGILEHLIPLAEQFIVVTVRSSRSSTAEALASVVQRLAPGVPCRTTPNVPTALEVLAARGPDLPPVLITGSLYLIGEALDCLESQPDGSSD